MIQEQMEEERQARVADVEEMRSKDEEKLHHTEPLDQVENSYYNTVFVFTSV